MSPLFSPYEAFKTGKGSASFGKGKNWYVTMKDSVADHRDTKLLVLASAIAFDMQIAEGQKNRGGA